MALELNTTEDGRVQFHGLFEDLQMGPLLLWILEEEQQGELTITTEGQQQIIYFADGYPVGTRGGAAENFLGWVLREKGHINDSAYLTSLQRMAEEQQLQGQILLQMGAIDQDQLMDALVLQLQRKLIRLFRPTQGEFSFVSVEDLDIFDVEIGAINPYTLTANAVRQEFSKERLDHCLSALDGFAFRLDPDSQWQERAKELQLENDEIAALSLLEPWNSKDNFLSQGYLDPIPTQVLIALLFSSNLLELDEEQLDQVGRNIAKSATPSAPPPSAPPPSAPAPRGPRQPSPPLETEGVSIRVETARRPGAAPDPNAPRKRASVTIHVRDDKIETETQSDLQAVSTAPAGDAVEIWSGSAYEGVKVQESTDPSIESISPLVIESAATPLGEMPGEFILPQDEDVQTDPSLEGVTQDQLDAVLNATPARRPMPPPRHAAEPVSTAPIIMAAPPPSQPVIAAPPPQPSAPIIAGPPPAAIIAGPPPAAIIAGPPPAAIIAGPPPAARPQAPPAQVPLTAKVTPGSTRPTQSAPSAAARPASMASAAPTKSTPTPSAQPVAAANAKLSPEDKKLSDNVIAKKKNIADANHYQILEISDQATPNDIRKAYYAQSRAYHPDSVAGTPLEHLKEDLDLIFSHLNVAYSTLSDPEERKEYDVKLADPEAAALEERAPKAAQAEVFFSKANVFLKKKDFANAEEQLQWAAKLLPDEGDFQMTLAWAIYHNPSRTRQESIQKALFHLEAAKSCGNADPQKMHFYWGHILKEENNIEGALNHFNALLKHNPRHVDAVREVRYLKMQLRNERGEPKEATNKPTEKKGLFGFLKK